jgi:hypothetical protein
VTQFELGLDPEEERRDALELERVATQLAIAQAEANAPEQWLHDARETVRHLAHAHPTFIVDAVWDTGLPKPPEARAIGPVMLWAAREGLIVGTDQFIPSAQEGCHGVPRRVWRSLAFEVDQ